MSPAPAARHDVRLGVQELIRQARIRWLGRTLPPSAPDRRRRQPLQLQLLARGGSGICCAGATSHSFCPGSLRLAMRRLPALLSLHAQLQDALLLRSRQPPETPGHLVVRFRLKQRLARLPHPHRRAVDGGLEHARAAAPAFMSFGTPACRSKRSLAASTAPTCSRSLDSQAA